MKGVPPGCVNESIAAGRVEGPRLGERGRKQHSWCEGLAGRAAQEPPRGVWRRRGAGVGGDWSPGRGAERGSAPTEEDVAGDPGVSQGEWTLSREEF